ncbi:MAG: type II toxin-antitoxin system RelE/ParE family toxin [Castellaniella sp.]|uniref:Type II toxin-antitoxin system RelE/ParE family toxin n=1 Tax=Castellaniella hirudinis TaxID=1144617 RepID=A0ABV8RXK2_9BURK
MTIQSFLCEETRCLFMTGSTRRFTNFQQAAERKLAQLDAAVTLDFLRSPPGNRLEKLTGDRQGRHSIRINAQWRICFIWTDEGPTEVEIVDYH